MSILIREFRPEDAEYAAAVAVHNAAWPGRHETVESWRFGDAQRQPQFFYRRYIAEVRGQVVAVGSMGEPEGAYEPGKYFVILSVHPDHQRQGIGSALYAHMLAELAPREPSKLIAWTREDFAGGVSFLKGQGFTQVMRAPRSELDLCQFSPGAFGQRMAKTRATGIEWQSVAELLEKDPACKHKLHDAIWEFLQDVPATEPRTRFPQDVWERRVFDNPNFVPQGWWVALDQENYVGITMLFRTGDPERLHTGLTGVTRSHRRLGVATALKVTALQWAKAEGYRYVATENEENNPMFNLNLQLGFVAQPGWLDFAKQLGE